MAAAKKQKIFEIVPDDVINGVEEKLGPQFLSGKRAFYMYHDDNHEALFVSKEPITKRLVAPLLTDLEAEEEDQIEPDDD